MKKSLVVMALAAMMVAAFASPAFALHGAYNSTGASCAECHSVHDAVGGNGVDTNAAGQALFVKLTGASVDWNTATKPWESWSAFNGNTTTNNSGIPNAGNSHNVENTNTENLCEYCHVYGGHVIQQVYGQGTAGNPTSSMAVHAIGASTIPNGSGAYWTLRGNGAGALGCIDCHNALPHAAKSGKTYAGGSKSRLVLPTFNSPAGTSIYTQDLATDASAGGSGQVVNAFCGRCHDQNMTMSLGGTSHVLTTNTTMHTTNYGASNATAGQGQAAVQVVWNSDTATCVKCHGSTEFHDVQAQAGTVVDGPIGWDRVTEPLKVYNGVVTTPNALLPMFKVSTEATGNAFTSFALGKGYGGSSGAYVKGTLSHEVADGLCLSCHMDSTGTSGVGLTF